MEGIKSIYLPQFTIGERAFERFGPEMGRCGKKDGDSR